MNVLREEKYELDNLNIIIADSRYLRELNKRFLKKNSSTNVISFNMDELSEIYISRDAIKHIEDLYYYISHGLLHIIGYEHQRGKENKIMRDKCIQYMSYVE